MFFLRDVVPKYVLLRVKKSYFLCTRFIKSYHKVFYISGQICCFPFTSSIIYKHKFY